MWHSSASCAVKGWARILKNTFQKNDKFPRLANTLAVCLCISAGSQCGGLVSIRQPGARKAGAWQTPRRPHDSDGPVPVCGVRAFPVGPGREERGEPRMGLPKRRGGLPLLLSGSRQPGAWRTPRRPHDSDVLGRKCEFPPQPSDRANISPRLEQRCTVVVYGLPRYQRGPFGEWDAGASDGRQLRHTPDAALRIHVRVGKLVLKTQTEEHASALNTSGLRKSPRYL